MSATDNSEIHIPERIGTTGVEDVELGNLIAQGKSSAPKGESSSYGIRKPKRLIHFSDGQTMEDPYDKDDTDDVGQNSSRNGIEKPFAKEQFGSGQLESQPPVNPKILSWPEWMKYYSGKGGSKVMGGLEGAGETLAYYLGITTPKYQQEINEYNRMVDKKTAEEDEAKAWASTNPSSVPIVSDPVKTEDLEASKSLTVNTDRL